MNIRRIFIYLATGVGILILSPQSYATVTCSFDRGYSVVNFSAAISTSISVPRNAAIGSIGNEILLTNGGATTNVTCSGGQPGEFARVLNKLISPGDTTSISAVYQTNVPGIGFKIRSASTSSYNSGALYTIWDFIYMMWGQGFTSSNKELKFKNNISKVYIQFYVVGPVTPGRVTFNVPTMSSFIGPDEWSEVGALNYSNFTITGSVPVTVLACETPDISVNLDKHKKSDFPDTGSTSSPTHFNFVIKNCPARLNSVYYTFSPATGIATKGSGTSQYLTLDGSSTAQGVGVQLLYKDGTPVPFNTKTQYTGYVASTSGDYTIPMQARYIRTGTISPGTANSAVEFDMSYE